MRRNPKLLLGISLGFGVVAILAGLTAYAVIATPVHSPYKPVITQQEHIPKEQVFLSSLPLDPYIEGWKDGVAFPSFQSFQREQRKIPKEQEDRTVPEPSTLLLTLFGLAYILRRTSR